MVTVKVASMVEIKDWWHPTIDAPLVTTKPTMIPPFGCKWEKRLVVLLSVSQLSNACHHHEPIENHQLTWGVMATSIYGDLHPGSRRVGMMLRNLSAHEAKIPHKTIISNVQTAEIVPNMKVLAHACEAPPSKEQKGTITGWLVYLLKFPWRWVYISQPLYLCSWTQMFWPQSMMCWTNWVSWGVLRYEPWGPTRSEENFKRVCGCLC